LGIIQAALELTRSEVRATDADVGEVAVDALMQRVANDTHVPAEKADLHVGWNVAAGLPPLRADAIKLEMVIKNLISNAIKFTDTGSVQVSVAPLEGAMQFIIADTGIGIDPEDLRHIFEPFTQAHGCRSRRAGGAGFGLYIVGRLVELLGGTVRVESRPDVGTTFTVTIPSIMPQPT
jgi:signal transduction histidine kinase